MYYLYVHTVPNGKIYIGQSKKPVERWANGEGYIENKHFYSDIQIYGWSRIKHEIIAEYEYAETARQMETALIVLLNSEDPDVGYNQTDMRKKVLSAYQTRKPFEKISLTDATPNISIFEASGLPVSACREIINQWVFNEQHRQILIDRFINGLSYPELNQKYKLSVRYLKKLVYDYTVKLNSHL